MKLYLIRHAHAGSRRQWDAPDDLRPLSDRGAQTAEALADQLVDAGIDLLWTSPYVRCRQTLEPLAARLGLEIADAGAIAEGAGGPTALDAVLRVAAARTLAICSHGDVIPAMAATAVQRGADLEGPRALAKGARYDATVKGGQIRRLVAVDVPGR